MELRRCSIAIALVGLIRPAYGFLANPPVRLSPATSAGNAHVFLLGPSFNRPTARSPACEVIRLCSWRRKTFESRDISLLNTVFLQSLLTICLRPTRNGVDGGGSSGDHGPR